MDKLCEQCKNRMFVHFNYGGQRYRCIYGECDVHLVDECSHFEEKPKDYPKEKEEVNDLLKKGQGKEPRSRENCFKKKLPHKNLGFIPD